MTLFVYLFILLVFFLVFYKNPLFPNAKSSEQTMTLNIQSFELSGAEESQIEDEMTEESLEEITKNLFEKISNSQDLSTLKISTTGTSELSLEEITKKIFKKIADSEISPEKKDEAKEHLTKLVNEQKKTKSSSKSEDAIKKIERSEKLEQEKLAILKNKNTLTEEVARLAELEQESLKKEETKKLKKLEEKKIEEKLQEAMVLKKLMQKKLAKRKKEKELRKKKKREKRLRKKKEREQKIAKEKLRKKNLLKKKQAKKLAKQKEKEKNSLASNIIKSSKQHSPQRKSRSSSSMINKFYGSEFAKFTGTQQAFIEKNLGNIYRITQRTLTRNGYPEVAARTKQEGTQLVTFYLHPNGKITGLRYKKSLGYASLDENTIKVIGIAYKDYPRPTTKTKITFYVEYSLH